MKTHLPTALLALSLSACSIQTPIQFDDESYLRGVADEGVNSSGPVS